MIDIIINDKAVSIQRGLTILQACEVQGILIPRFCYHEQLSIAGNCRMCLVEIDKSLKPIASCAITCEAGMKIYTNTLLVKKAREGVMEFLLANHPLDCPICDQGGECDLQDQAMLFGNDRGRFYENKRAVSDINLGPFIKTVMTRCIHCTRCIRFLTELGDSFVLGTTGRGNKTEINNYVNIIVDSEVSGNIIDLCPVGALTSKPYAFTARAWELTKIESIDTLDSMCSNVSYNIFGGKILRVLPVLHIGINEEWITNTIRFSYDGYTVQRLAITLKKVNNSLTKTSLQSIFHFFATYINTKLLIIIGEDLSLEALYNIRTLKLFLHETIILLKHRLVKKNVDFRHFYIFNTTYAGLSKGDLVVLVGCNLKTSYPLLLLKLRKEKKRKNLRILIFGSSNCINLEEINSGLSSISFIKCLEGKHKNCVYIKKANNPVFIFGTSIVDNIVNLYSNLIKIPNMFTKVWNGLNFVQLGSGDVGFDDMGLQSAYITTKMQSIWNINALSTEVTTLHGKNIFFGTHGADSLYYYDIVIPIKSNIEQVGLFSNNEGRVQATKVIQVATKNTNELSVLFLKIFDKMFIKQSSIYLNPKQITQGIQKLCNSNLNLVSYQTFNLLIKKKFFLTNNMLMSYESDEYNKNRVTKYSRILVKAKQYKKKNNYI
jgi:NADH-quinone oxidoreductase chain G